MYQHNYEIRIRKYCQQINHKNTFYKLVQFLGHLEGYIYYFYSYKMQTSQLHQIENSESYIIDLANNIYQNLGIKRWIEQIAIFRNVETYFQICQIIFPDSAIDFYRIDHDNTTQAQKLQSIIHYLSDLINNDLSHISGQEIAKGNPTHIINFLELLEALSNNMIQDEDGCVQSARQCRASSNEGEGSSYYTVMAINQEFQKPQYRNQQEENDTANQNERHQAHIDRSRPSNGSVEQSSNTSADFPIKPIKKLPPQMPSMKRQQNRDHIKTHKKSKRVVHAQIKLKKYEEQNHKLINLVKKIYQSKQELNVNYGRALKTLYSQQYQFMQMDNCQHRKNIDKQMKFRHKVVQSKLSERSSIMKSLQGAGLLNSAIKNIITKEQQLKKQATAKNYERELKNAENLMDFDELEKLFKKAVSSNHPKPIHRNK